MIWIPVGDTGFYGDKILYKNLKFFDKIFVPTFCRRRFCNALYGKILRGNVMFGHGFDKLVYPFLCGGDTKFKLSKAGNGNRQRIFSLPVTRVRFAREGKAVALQYHEQ